MSEAFDISRVHWEKEKFKPWYLTQRPVSIRDLRINPNEEIIVVELSGKSIGFIQREVVYHHIIQGSLNNSDFLLTFCGVCNAGVLMSPVLDGKLYHFQEVGVYNGQQIFEDKETNSLWNHLTGEALHGKLKGKNLEIIGYLRMTTLGEEKKSDPDLPIYVSGQQKLYGNIMRFIIKVIIGKSNKNWLPPHFEKTLPVIDESLPKMTMGLAVKINNIIRFYPVDLIKKGIVDNIEGETIEMQLINKIPMAKKQNGERPFQLFTRWYAYILTYPNGELFEK